MCCQNCIHENWQGECKLATGKLDCPPDYSEEDIKKPPPEGEGKEVNHV